MDVLIVASANPGDGEDFLRAAIVEAYGRAGLPEIIDGLVRRLTGAGAVRHGAGTDKDDLKNYIHCPPPSAARSRMRPRVSSSGSSTGTKSSPGSGISNRLGGNSRIGCARAIDEQDCGNLNAQYL